jgi:iron(III) transport system ATP-binding protein
VPEIALANLSKRFGSLIAVDDVTLTADDGEFLTLLGPSGCGKTTTLRMVAGLEQPTAGCIRIGERAVYDSARGIDVPPESRGLGMVFQSYAIWPHMTVAENVAYPLRMRRVARSERDVMVRQVLDLVGLSGMGDKPSPQLSGGQQQRVALARALVFQPQLLLLDEPLSNLDAKLREQMRFELRIMQQRIGLTALYVTHDQEEALTLSDRLVVMNRGVVEQVGTPVQIYEQPATRFVAEFIGKGNMISIPETTKTAGGGQEVRLRAIEGGVTAFEVPGANIRVENGRLASDGGTLFIRPERINLVAGSDDVVAGRFVLTGKVKARAYAGNHVEYLVSINEDTDLKVEHPAGEAVVVGDSVRLAIAPDDMILYV